MRAPLLLLGAINVAASASDPGVFEDYFDDQIRSVDIPQESALKACLSNGDATGKKIQTAYDGCFGTDYDFNDLAENEEGKDSDGDDLPDEFEANEACFYSAMGWVSTDGSDVSLDTLEADMAGLGEAVAKDFKANAKSCSKWSGDFGGGRRKREAGEEEVVPDLMASGRRSLGWVKSMARKTRSAEKGGEEKQAKKGKGNKKKAGKKGGATKKAAKKTGKGKKGKGKKGGARKKAAEKTGKGKTGKGKKGGARKKAAKKTGKGKKGKGKKGGARKKAEKGGKGKMGKGAGRNKKGGKVNKGKGAGGKGDKAKKGKGGKGEGKKGTKKEGNKKRNGKGDKEKQMDEKIYNKLWCFDLAIEQALEKCVEDKIKN